MKKDQAKEGERGGRINAESIRINAEGGGGRGVVNKGGGGERERKGREERR